MQELNVTLNDPFDLIDLQPSVAVTQRRLRYNGLSKAFGLGCFQLEAQNVDQPPAPGIIPFGSITQWWIDPENCRPSQVVLFSSGFVQRMRFTYDTVNEQLPAADFAIPQLQGRAPEPPELLDADYTRRFIDLDDGSDGSMSLRWGKKGPKGSSSSGLN
jgi:hypothetical protein